MKGFSKVVCCIVGFMFLVFFISIVVFEREDVGNNTVLAGHYMIPVNIPTKEPKVIIPLAEGASSFYSMDDLIKYSTGNISLLNIMPISTVSPTSSPEVEYLPMTEPTVVPTFTAKSTEKSKVKIKKKSKKKNSIHMNTHNVLEKSNITAKELRSVLRPNLKQFSDDFVKAEKEDGVNALFLAAISTLESGGNTHQKYPNNIMGWEGNRSFSSEEECIAYVSKRLRWWYLSKPHKSYKSCKKDHPGQINEYGVCLYGINYNGISVSAVNERYNGKQHWEDSVILIMREYYDGIKGRRKD